MEVRKSFKRKSLKRKYSKWKYSKRKSFKRWIAGKVLWRATILWLVMSQSPPSTRTPIMESLMERKSFKRRQSNRPRLAFCLLTRWFRMINEATTTECSPFCESITVKTVKVNIRESIDPHGDTQHIERWWFWAKLPQTPHLQQHQSELYLCNGIDFDRTQPK